MWVKYFDTNTLIENYFGATLNRRARPTSQNLKLEMTPSPCCMDITIMVMYLERENFALSGMIRHNGLV